MKTIVDIFEMILVSIHDHCYTDSNMNCTICKKYNYCHVNASLQAASMVLWAGEYH